MIVPKRIRGLGWTLNFARPLAVPFLGFILAVVYGVLELTRSFGAGGDARFAIKLLLALGIMALCYRLSSPPTKNAQAESDSNHRNGKACAVATAPHVKLAALAICPSSPIITRQAR